MKKCLKHINAIIKSRLNNTKGFAAAEIIVALLIFIMILAATLNIFPIFIQGQNLNHMATELVRTAEITGQVGTNVEARYAELQESTGIQPKSISWEGTEYMSTPNNKKIQINKPIKVTLTYDYIGKISNIEFPITIRSVADGRSEVYTK